MRIPPFVAALVLLVAACGSDADPAPPTAEGAADRGAAPEVPSGPLDDALAADLDALAATALTGVDTDVVERVGAAGDARAAWLLSDLLRFQQGGASTEALVEAFEALTDTPIVGDFAWGEVTDHLIAWDLPAPPGYRERKAEVFLAVEPAWAPFFEDADADIDWRLLSWGGVLVDDRPLDAVDEPCPGGCIPALDDPAVTDAAGGDWYPDGDPVFGVVVDGEARAYPKNIMEVHEMVNDTLGGRRIGVPYCTLCLSAQAYLTDDVADGVEVPGDVYELRTSGLLSRSNKVMFEFHTRSVFDTFTGEALSGPLRDADVVLEQLPVVTSSWGEWKAAHPDTTIVAEDGGIGRDYPADPLRGRDDDGPIFPIGDVDPRLDVQERVLGVESPSTGPIAFSVVDLRTAELPVVVDDIRVVADGGGFRAETLDGDALPSHEAFWFAWSQFFPATELWAP